MDPHVTIVTLGVDDPAESLAFYRDGLGLPVEEEVGDYVSFDLSGVRLALYPGDALAEESGVPPGESGFGGTTLSHNVDSREAVDAVLAEAEAAGATVTSPAAATHWGGYAGCFADPDGHLWEVATTGDAAEE